MSSCTADPGFSNLLDLSFKRGAETTAASATSPAEFLFGCSKSVGIVSAFIQNYDLDLATKQHIGDTEVWLSDASTPFDTTGTKILSNIRDTGFHSITLSGTTVASGQSIFVRRNDPDPVTASVSYGLAETRFYETPNLMVIGQPEIVESATPTTAAHGANNLITSLVRRQASSTYGVLNNDGSETSSKTCFVTNRANVGATNKYVLGVKFNKPYFMNAILVVQDVYAYSITVTELRTKRFKHFDIYIGNSATYSENPKCANGPFSKTDSTDSFDSESGWNFGAEIWCNMEGQYIFLVADYTGSTDDYEIAICSFGVFGTTYVPQGAIPTSINIPLGATVVTTLPLIVSATPIGTLIDTKYRFLEGTNPVNNVSTASTIQNNGLELSITAGLTETVGRSFTVNIQAFNQNTVAQSSILSRSITVTVTAAQPPEFLVASLGLTTILSQTVQTLPLPSIKRNSHDVDRVELVLDSVLTNCLTVAKISATDPLQWQLSYDGSDLDSAYNLPGTLDIKIYDTQGTFKTYIASYVVKYGGNPRFLGLLPPQMPFVENYIHSYTYPQLIGGATAIATKTFEPYSAISTRWTFDDATLTLTFDTIETPLTMIGTPYTITITVTNTGGQTQTFTQSLQINAEIKPSYASTPPSLDFTESEPQQVTWPAALGGSFPLLSSEVTSDPCCLADYISMTQPIGETNPVNGKKVAISLSSGTIADFAGDLTLLEGNQVGTFTIKVKLINTKTFTEVDFSAVIRKIDAPKFNIEESELPLQEIITGTPFTYQLPAIVEGLNTPATAEFTMSPGLSPAITTLSSVVDTSLQLSIAYSGLGLEPMIDKEGIGINVRLWGGLKKTFTDTIIPILVEQGSVPTFAELPSELRVYVGTAAKYVYPAIIPGKNKLGSVIIEVPTEMAPFVTIDTVKMTLTYDGSKEAVEMKENFAYILNITLNDEFIGRSIYTQTVYVDHDGYKPSISLEGVNAEDLKQLAIECQDSEEQFSLKKQQAEEEGLEFTEEFVQSEECASLETTVDALSEAGALKSFGNLEDLDLETLDLTAVTQVLDQVSEAIESGALSISGDGQIETFEIELDVELEKMQAELGLGDIVIPPVSEKQEELLNTPVEEIEPTLLFTPVPLVARLTSGIDNVKALILRQREQVTSLAAQSQGLRPPEVRIRKFDSSGGLSLRFTSEISFPAGTETKIKDQTLENKRRLSEGLPAEKSLVEVFAVRAANADEDEVREPIMKGWELISLSKDGIDFKFEFNKPLLVSTGEEPDLILVQLDMSEFKDENGNQLQDSLLKYSPIPTQIASEEEAKQVEQQGSTASESTSTATASNFVINVLMSGPLNKVWAIIEGLQVVVHMPLFKVKSPGNVTTFADFMAQLASVELIDTQSLKESLMYIPEIDGFSLNFQTAGFQSTLVLANIGTMLLMFLKLFIILFIWLFVYLVAMKIAKIQKVRDKLRYYLFWNGTIRVFLTGYLDFCMLALINLKEMYWPDELVAVSISNWLAIFLASLCVIFPIFFFVFLLWNIKNLDDEHFQKKVGAILEGTNSGAKDEHRWTVIMIPTTYFVRRLSMSCTLVFWQEFLWGQVAIQLATSILLIIILQLGQPMESKFANNMETFNEVITLCILYILMCFSDFLPDSEMRSEVGKSFIGVVCVFAAVHFFFLIGDTFNNIKLQIKKLFNRCKKKQSSSPDLVSKETETALRVKPDTSALDKSALASGLDRISEESESQESDESIDPHAQNIPINIPISAKPLTGEALRQDVIADLQAIADLDEMDDFKVNQPKPQVPVKSKTVGSTLLISMDELDEIAQFDSVDSNVKPVKKVKIQDSNAVKESISSSKQKELSHARMLLDAWRKDRVKKGIDKQ